MSARRDRLRASLFILFAVAAPWDVFLFLPGLHFRLTWVLALAIVALEFVDYLHSRRIGVRFELLWPAFFLLVLALPPIRIVPAEGAMAILLGLAAARSAGPLLTGQIMTALAFSLGPLAVFTVLVNYPAFLPASLAPPPSAYSLNTGLVVPFGRTAVECGVLLYAGFAIACSRFLRGDRENPARWGLIIVAAVTWLALFVFVFSSLGALGAWRPPDYFASWGTIIAAILGGWLLARILAKSFIHWRELRHTISENTTSILAGIAVFALLFLMEFRMLWGFLAGIAAGAAQSDRDLAPPPRKWAYALVPLALLAAANSSGVYPADTTNPRNYEATARQDFAEGDFAELEKRLDYFETYWPKERRTHLWRARVALARGLLHETAYEITLACQPADNANLLLPPPTFEEIDALLVRVRDACSQSESESASLAHIQALLGAGKYDHAKALVDQALNESESVALPEDLDEDLETEAYGCPCSWSPRTAAMRTVWPEDPQEPMEMEAIFPENLSGAAWLRLLVHWGAELHVAPEDVPRERLPLVCIAKIRRSHIELSCISAKALLAHRGELAEQPSQYDPKARYAAFQLRPGAQARWRETTGPDSEAFAATLEIDGAELITAEFSKTIALRSTPPEESLPAPDTPIIAIWL